MAPKAATVSQAPHSTPIKGVGPLSPLQAIFPMRKCPSFAVWNKQFSLLRSDTCLFLLSLCCLFWGKKKKKADAACSGKTEKCPRNKMTPWAAGTGQSSLPTWGDPATDGAYPEMHRLPSSRTEVYSCTLRSQVWSMISEKPIKIKSKIKKLRVKSKFVQYGCFGKRDKGTQRILPCSPPTHPVRLQGTNMRTRFKQKVRDTHN